MKHKDYYNEEYIHYLSKKIGTVIEAFDSENFCQTLTGNLEDKELFERLDCIVDALNKTLPRSYTENIKAFFKILGPKLEQSQGMFNIGWWLWPIGRYVERYGNEDWMLSLAFLKELTKRFTGEYAIRSLLREHPKEVMDELINWTKEENVHVRRLASEGVRIRLPWSQNLFVALDEFERYYCILTNLKDDPEKFVQKSVGNNLNDLYKYNPQKADFIINEWIKSGQSKAQNWIIKHGRRKKK